MTVTGVNDHGIFVQDSSNIDLGLDRAGDGVAPTSGIAKNKAIDLVGTSDSSVVDNLVSGNLAEAIRWNEAPEEAIRRRPLFD